MTEEMVRLICDTLSTLGLFALICFALYLITR